MRRRELILSAALAGACLLVFGQAVRFGFLNYDDNAYVYENPWVRGGLTFHGIIWAFNVVDYFYWQPLTWLSHMLDCQLFGLRPAWPHLVNVLFHAANAILVFLIFRRLTGAFWRSAVLAALFALHPLRVESVVWIAERKDVLSAFWFLVTVAAYLRFVERPSGPRYACVLAAFAFGLMSKPMLITAPVLLLLLDYWPLAAARPGREDAAVPDGRVHSGGHLCRVRATARHQLGGQPAARASNRQRPGFLCRVSWAVRLAAPSRHPLSLSAGDRMVEAAGRGGAADGDYGNGAAGGAASGPTWHSAGCGS